MHNPDNNQVYLSATDQIQKLLLDWWPDKPEHASVNIYTWPDHQKTYGLRVAEVSLSSIDPASGTGSGASFMQSDDACGSAILAVERAILELHHMSEAPHEDEVNDLFDAKWRAIFTIHGEEAAAAFAGSFPGEVLTGSETQFDPGSRVRA